MEEQIRNCIGQACLARQKALQSEDIDQARQWRLIASMWDEMANEYKAITAGYENLALLKMRAGFDRSAQLVGTTDRTESKQTHTDDRRASPARP